MRRPTESELRAWTNHPVTEYIQEKLQPIEAELVRKLEDPETEFQSLAEVKGLQHGLKAVRCYTKDPQQLLEMLSKKQPNEEY